MESGEVDERDAGIRGEGLGDLGFGKLGVVDQVLDERFRTRKRGAGLLDLFAGYIASFEQEFCEIIFVGKHRELILE